MHPRSRLAATSTTAPPEGLLRRHLPEDVHPVDLLGRCAHHLGEQGLPGARSAPADTVTYAADVVSAVSDAGVVVFTTPWPEYAGMAGLAGPRTVVDCWQCCTDGYGWEKFFNERMARGLLFRDRS